MPIGRRSYSSCDFRPVTRRSRARIRHVFETASAARLPRWLDVPEELCLARLGARNAAGAHQFATPAEE